MSKYDNKDLRFDSRNIELMSAFVRKHSNLRYLNPKNILGNILGYANCDCGNTLWRTDTNSYQINVYTGMCICDECYAEKKEEIDRYNHTVLSEPRISRVDGKLEYLMCQDKDCEWHKNDDRFEYVEANWHCWRLKEEKDEKICV